jgi:hypothetical protein
LKYVLKTHPEYTFNKVRTVELPALPIKPLKLGEPAPHQTENEWLQSTMAWRKLQAERDAQDFLRDLELADQGLYIPPTKPEEVEKPKTPEQYVIAKISGLLNGQGDKHLFSQTRHHRYDAWFAVDPKTSVPLLTIYADGKDNMQWEYWTDLLISLNDKNYEIEDLKQAEPTPVAKVESIKVDHKISVKNFVIHNAPKDGKPVADSFFYRNCKCGKSTCQVVTIDGNKPQVICKDCLSILKAQLNA